MSEVAPDLLRLLFMSHEQRKNFGKLLKALRANIQAERNREYGKEWREQ